MIERLFTECNKSCVEGIIESLAGSIGGKPSIAVREGAIYANIAEDRIDLVSIRLTSDISELMLSVIPDKAIPALEILGLKKVAELINRLKVLPSVIAISRIRTSRSLYIILQGRTGSEAFPNIKVVIRENYHEASASFCRITPEENTCEFLYSLLKIARDLWAKIFKDIKRKQN
ncbi:MAG: hypothetical protein DRO14_01075 [Thermoprotei archaeon]|nr:MAG: hypothetical protein DRO14_01075 [Thermoprotei archaeon]